MAGIDPKTTMDRARQRRNGIRTSGQVNARVDRVERTDLLAPSGLIEKITGITEPSYIKFTTTPALPSAGWVEGHLYWDADWDILSVRLNDDVDMHLGMSIYMPPTNNNSGVTIPRGSFVMATGVLGDRITIAKAVTNGTIAPDYMIGVAAHDIAAGDTDGKIVTQGEVRQFDTSAYVVGTILYPNPTTPGGWTSTKPAAPNIRTSVAYVTRQHVNTGRIMVRMHQGSVLGGTDQNVKFGTLADNDVVTWDNTQQLWVNEPASANALPGISGTGIVVRSATTPSYLTRTLTGTSNQITVSDGTGVLGNPTLTLSSTLRAPGTLSTTGWAGVKTTAPLGTEDFTIGDATDTDLYLSMRGRESPGASEIRLVQGTIGGPNNAFMGTATNHPFAFRTNNTDRMTVGASGDVTFTGNVTVNGNITSGDANSDQTVVRGWLGIQATSPYSSSDVTIGDATDEDLYIAMRGKEAAPSSAEIRLVQGVFGGTNNGFVGTATNHGFAIRTDNIDRMTIAAGGNTTFTGNLYQQNGEPVPFMDGSRTSTTTFTSTTEASVVASVGSYALTAGSTVRGYLWGFYGNTSGTATLTLALRQSTTDVVTVVIPTVSAQTNSTANPFWIQFHANILTTTTATAIAHATTVTNADAEGDVSTNRIDLSANTATISASALAWNISADWSTTTGTPTATIMGGYIQFAIV